MVAATALVGTLTGILDPAVAAADPAGVSEYRVVVSYSGGERRVEVPIGATEAYIEAGGGDGGTASPCTNWHSSEGNAAIPFQWGEDPAGASGGGGTWIHGTFPVRGGQSLLVAPGGAGQTVDVTPRMIARHEYTGVAARGGWGLNGANGGNAAVRVTNPDGSWADPDGDGPIRGADAIGTVAGGGGATTVRFDDSSKSTILVAGGGGGGGACGVTSGGTGGSAAGGIPGQNKRDWLRSLGLTPGNQSFPLGGSAGTFANQPGSAGQNSTALGGGGGGGYRGGGAGGSGQNDDVSGDPMGSGGGGAGSSYTMPGFAVGSTSGAWTTTTQHDGEVRIVFRGSNLLVPPENVALAGSVAASSSLENGQWSRAALTDGRMRSGGDVKGYTSDVQPGAWWSQSVTVDLGRVQAVDQLTLFPRTAVPGEDRAVTGAGFPRNFTVQVSEDGQSWTNAGSFTDQSADGGGAVTYPLAAGSSGRYVRLDVSRLGRNAPGDGFRLQLAEVQVSGRGSGDVALGAAVSSPSAFTGFGFSPAGLTDGQANALPGNNGYSSVVAAAMSVDVDLGAERPVGRMVLHPRVARADEPADVTGAGFPRTFDVMVSNDGSTWRTAGHFEQQSADDGTARSYDLTAPTPDKYTARYIRLNVVEPGRAAGYGDNEQRLQLAEVQAFAPPAWNLARAKTVDAATSLELGGSNGSFGKSQLTDGVVGSSALHGYTSDGHASSVAQEWVGVDLGRSRLINAVVLSPRTAFGTEDAAVTGASFPKAFQIQVSDDGTTWSTAGSYLNQQADDGKDRAYGLAAGTTGRYIKVVTSELGRSARGDNGFYRLQLAEMTVLGN
ncbi:discoidin domain-containing protein [Nakamurella sp.]|uniref:discoidin domain-containing protein n=1 Tax=Nakamurella sp. TaxID=1869182 RepID=UPI0037849F0B